MKAELSKNNYRTVKSQCLLWAWWLSLSKIPGSSVMSCSGNDRLSVEVLAWTLYLEDVGGREGRSGVGWERSLRQVLRPPCLIWQYHCIVQNYIIVSKNWSTRVKQLVSLKGNHPSSLLLFQQRDPTSPENPRPITMTSEAEDTRKEFCSEKQVTEN